MRQLWGDTELTRGCRRMLAFIGRQTGIRLPCQRYSKCNLHWWRSLAEITNALWLEQVFRCLLLQTSRIGLNEGVSKLKEREKERRRKIFQKEREKRKEFWNQCEIRGIQETGWGKGGERRTKKWRKREEKDKKFASANCMRYAIVSCIFSGSSRWK